MFHHALLALAVLVPPPTAAEPVTEDMHGVAITDEYRWLEALESESTRVEEWTTQQLDYTRSVLDNLPGRAALEQRLEELMTLPSVSTPAMRGERYFYRKRQGRQNQDVLYMRLGHDGDPRAILDVNELDPSGLISLDWYAPDRAGRLVAFGLSRAGNEETTLHVLDVDRAVWLPEEIPGKVSDVEWLPDSRGFFYRDLADVKNPYSGRIRFHALGTHRRHDRTLFEQYTEGPLATTWGPFASISRDARWMLLGYFTGTKSNDLRAVDLDRWMRTGEFVPVDVIVGDDSTNGGPVLGDTLFLETTAGAPNGRVFAVDLNNPARANWVEIIPERERDVLRSVALARGRLVVNYLKSAATALEVFSLAGKPLGSIALPGPGSAGVSTDEDRTEAFYSFTSYNAPPSVWRTDLATGATELWDRVDVPFDAADFVVKQEWFASADGTKVSMFLVHRKDLALDGSSPALLYGYGGFNIPLTPAFESSLVPWLEGGGVYAVANLRGGGEYGQAWHEAGMLEHKQNVFDDFIGAGEYLVAKKYTTPARLVIRGGSNGGLLVGAAVTQRPDLFSGAVCGVPLLDMLRYERFLMARYWVPEYGDPQDPSHFEWLYRYSPYQHVSAGVRYPAILITAGENDSRVHPLHARKMAARLQARTAADPGEEPVLLWVERSAGHGAGKPLRLRIRDAADQWIFLMWQSGMTQRPPGLRR
jgi:prolyl oligopeptidase